MGWIARAWTSVFPLTNWSFQLMALTNSALALWAVDLISRHFVRGDKRVVVLLFLMLLRSYQFHAQGSNANAVLLAIWPIATYCFLRSFESRQIIWAIVAGATAALAMLGKYYSVFLIGSFVFAAICHPQRRAYFGSAAPWISTIIGLVALGPHLVWLWTTGGMPFAYAVELHTGKPLGPSLIEALLFILGLGIVLVVPGVSWMLIAGNRLKRLSEDFWETDPSLWLLFLVAVGTIVFPVVTTVAFRTDMPPIWGLQGLFLFVVLIGCGTSFPIGRFYSVNLAILVLGMALASVIVVAPIHAIYRNTHPLHEGRNFYRQAALELTQQWHDEFDGALEAVGGDEGLAFATAFYSPDHPSFEVSLVLPNNERLPLQTASKRGWAAVCYGSGTACITSMERTAARASRCVSSQFEVQSRLLGLVGATQRITAIMVAPSPEATINPPTTPRVEDFSARGRTAPDAARP